MGFGGGDSGSLMLACEGRPGTSCRASSSALAALARDSNIPPTVTVAERPGRPASRHLIATIIASGPTSGLTSVSEKPASRIQRWQSSAV